MAAVVPERMRDVVDSFTSDREERVMRTGIVRSAWAGEVRLWKAFWLYFVLLLNLGVLVVGYVVGTFGLPYLAVWIVMAPVMVWAAVSVWRCAFNARWRGWGYLARIVVVVQMLLAGIHIISGEHPHGRYSEWHGPKEPSVPVP